MATDQEIRDAGLKYVPQQKYLLDPYILPTEEKEMITDQGIVNTNAFTNSGGGGNEPYIIPKDDDDETYTGSSMSTKNAAKEVGKMFLMGGPQAYIMQKLISKGIGAFKDYRNKNKVEKYTGQEMSNYRDDRPSSEKNYTGGDTNSNPSTPGAQDSFSNKSGMGRTGYFFGGRVNYKAGGRINFRGGGMDMGNESNQTQSNNIGGATGDFSTAQQTQNHDRAMRDNQREKPSTLNNAMNLGSELSYLNNLKNLNVPGIALNFGVNKFRNYMKNKNLPEEDKFSYNTNPLPTNNYFAEVQQKDLDASKMRGFKTQDYNSYLDQMNMLNDGTKVTPYEFQGLQDGSITTTGTFTAANGGRAMFKNGGLASIL